MSKLKVTNVDTKGDLLLAIFNRAWTVERDCFESAEEMMQTLPFHVKRTCLILKWLGLVERDDNHPFGCKPTRHLMPLVSPVFLHLVKAEIEKDYASPEDMDCLFCVYEAALPYETQRHGSIDEPGYQMEDKVLCVLGLATWSKQLETVPTLKLRRLAARIRNEHRRFKFAKSGATSGPGLASKLWLL